MVATLLDDHKGMQTYPFSTGADIARPARALDYWKILQLSPDNKIVIDNGAHFCRVGWSTEAKPRYEFRNLVSKPRSKSNGQTVSIVGDYDPSIAKSFDFSKSSIRSAFDSNVVYQFETMEAVLDYSFDRLGAEGGRVNHPIMMTECPANPPSSRAKMAELLFEAYGVPSVAFGVDSIFSHTYNRRLGRCSADGLLVSSGYATTHVIPMLGGEPLLTAACRTPIGGFHCTDFLKRFLSLHYPQHTTALTWQRVEEMKQRHAYVAYDYAQELRTFQAGGVEAERLTKTWQLPFLPPLPSSSSSSSLKSSTPEEVLRRAAIREKSGQRLKDMAAAKRVKKVEELQQHVEWVGRLVEEVGKAESEEEAAEVLSEAGYTSLQDVQQYLSQQTVALRKARGENVEEEEAEAAELPDEERFPLLNVPDSELTPEQVKEKRKQRFLKNAAEGRAKAKQKRDEEKAKAVEEKKAEEERRLADPKVYLEELRGKFSKLVESREQRKRQRLSGASASAVEVSLTSTSVAGRGERLTSAHRERMKLLTSAAFDQGKGEDSFGARDSDWLLYKQMGRDNEDEEEVEAEEAEYKRLGTRLQELDPDFAGFEGGTGAANGGLQQGSAVQQLTEEDYQIGFGVERIRASEIIFQPSIIAVDQAGLGEMLAAAIRRTPREFQNKVSGGDVLLTGGNAMLAGFEDRVMAEITRVKPLGSNVRIVTARNPLLDAWHGAALISSLSNFNQIGFTKLEYEEKGPDRLQLYSLKYM